MRTPACAAQIISAALRFLLLVFVAGGCTWMPTPVPTPRRINPTPSFATPTAAITPIDPVPSITALQVEASPTPAAPVSTPTSQSPRSALMEEAQPQKIFVAGRGTVLNYFLSPNGKLAAVCEGSQVIVFDTDTQAENNRTTLPDACSQVTFSADGTLLAVQVQSTLVYILDSPTLQPVSMVTGTGRGHLQGVLFSPDQRFLIYRERNGEPGEEVDSIQVWNIWEDRLQNQLTSLTKPGYRTMSLPAISRSGQWVAAGHTDKSVYIWNTETGELRHRLTGHAQEVTGVSFSPDQRSLASGSADGTVRIWDVSSGQLVRSITGFSDSILCLQFLPGGSSLRVQTAAGIPLTVDVRSGQQVYGSLPLSQPDPLRLALVRQGYVDGERAALSPDGQFLVLGDVYLQLWDITSGAMRHVLENPYLERASSFIFSSRGDYLAVLTESGSLVVWNTSTGKRLLPAYNERGVLSAPHTDAAPAAQSAAFSPSEDILALARQGGVELWQVDPPQLVGTLDIPSRISIYGLVSAGPLAFSADGKYLFAASSLEGTVLIWDTANGNYSRQVKIPITAGHTYHHTAMSWPWIARLTSQNNQSWLELHNLENGQRLRTGSQDSITGPFSFNSDGSMIAGIAGEGVVFWRTDSGERVTTFSLPGAPQYAVSSDMLLLAASDLGQVSAWDISSIYAIASQLHGELAGSAIEYTPSQIEINPLLPGTVQAMRGFEGGHVEAISSQNVSDLIEVGRFGLGTLETLQWRSDSKSAVTAGSLGISHYDISIQGRPLSLSSHHETGIWTHQVRYLPDGQVLAAGTASGRLLVWDTGSGDILFQAPGCCPVLSQDGQYLAYLDELNRLITIDLLSQQTLTWLRSELPPDLPVFSPDGNFIAAVEAAGKSESRADSVRVWNAFSGEIVQALGGPNQDITSLAYSSDGQFLVAASGGAAWWWQVSSGSVYSTTLDAHQPDVSATAVAISPNNRLVAIGDSQHNLWLYDRLNNQFLGKLGAHSSPVRALSFNPQGSRVLSVDEDGSLLLWDVPARKPLDSSSEHAGQFSGLIFRQDGLLSAWQAGTAWVLEASGGLLQAVTRPYSGTLTAASPAGDWLAVYHGGKISIWDASTGVHRRMFNGEASNGAASQPGVFSVVFNSTGRLLAVSSSSGVHVYDVGQGKLLYQFTGNHAGAAAFSPDSRRLVVSPNLPGNYGCLFDLVSGAKLFEFHSPSGLYTQFAPSPDGLWLGALSRGLQGEVHLEIWSLSGNRLIQDINFGSIDPPVAIAFSPITQLIAVGRSGGELVFVNLENFRVTASIQAPPASLDHLAFSGDGVYLASAGSDGAVRLWAVP